VEDRQGMMISCPEEIAYRMGAIGRDELRTQGEAMKSNEYGQYLLRLLAEDMPRPDNG
jgi:glucose-1-phosphate thymidylyltransferase